MLEGDFINGEVSTLLPAIYTVLIIGAGYVVLWIKFMFVNYKSKHKSDFYEMSAYDKAMQSLIAGIIVVAITCFISGTPYNIISSIETFIQLDRIIPFLSFQFLVMLYTGFAWAVLELVFLVDKKDRIKKKEGILIKW